MQISRLRAVNGT